MEEKNKRVSFIPQKRKTALTLERGSRQGSSRSTEHKRTRSTATLLLSRWLANTPKRDSSAEELNESFSSDERCMDYGTPPPVEEPYCYSLNISESTYEGANNSLAEINRETIRNTLIEHMRYVGGRLNLLEEFEKRKIAADKLEDLLKTCKVREINVLLLMASFLGREDLVPILIDHGADVNYLEQDYGLTALHLCAFSDSLGTVQYLLRAPHSANMLASKGHTPFHYAAFGNAVNVCKFFLQHSMCQESPQGDETVLHAAARSDSLDVLKLLAPNNPFLNRLDSDGFAPIHRASEGGDPSRLMPLLDAGCDVNAKTKNGDTVLHIAAEYGCVYNVDLLMKAGANVNMKNNRGQTPLHLASRSHSLDCVEILVKKGGCDPNVEDIEGRTPLHLALGKSLLAYDVAGYLVSVQADPNKVDKYGYTPLHVAAVNELSQCVDLLIRHGADLSARTKGGTTALSIILRKTPTSLNVFKQKLDQSITLHHHGSAAGEVEVRLDFHPLLLVNQKQGEIAYLGTFVKEGYKEILEHPLCQSFLYLKWQKIRKYYVSRLLFYLTYVISLTLWVMTALAHNCYNESHGVFDNASIPLCANSSGLDGFFYQHPIVLEIEWYALVSLNILEVIRKLTGMLTYMSVKQFFTQAENLVEWCVTFSVFATSFIYYGRTYTWQSHVGAFAVLCGWSNLMLMIGQLPMFGAYVAMFTSVQAQVFKLLLAYACLLVGFTASFCVIFPQSKSFSSPHTGLIKVLVMMTGELDFEDLFFPGDESKYVESSGTSWILLQVSAQLSFVLFLLFVTIVLMNLLVGIAVHDIKGLQKTAGLAKLVRQTKLICDVEAALFLGLFPHRLMKFLRWTALVLPSPLRVVLNVRPLNPREKRLPRDLLAAAHKVAREKKFVSTLASNKSENNMARCSISATTIRRPNRDGDFTIDPVSPRLYHDIAKLKELATTHNEVYDSCKEECKAIRELCEKNNQLIMQLAKVLALDNKSDVDSNK